MASFLADVSIVSGNSGGSFTSQVDKLLLHTTEGTSASGAVGAYRQANAWPHFTIDPVARTIDQHVGLDVAARALRNPAGGVQTNRDGVIQIEIVGQAANPQRCSTADYQWLGGHLGRICRAAGIPISAGVEFHANPYPPGVFAGSEPWRMSGAEWTSYSGWLGHQHAPENTHTDPGAIPIPVLLAAAGGTSAPARTSQLQEFTDMATKAELDQVMQTAIKPLQDQIRALDARLKEEQFRSTTRWKKLFART